MAASATANGSAAAAGAAPCRNTRYRRRGRLGQQQVSQRQGGAAVPEVIDADVHLSLGAAGLPLRVGIAGGKFVQLYILAFLVGASLLLIIQCTTSGFEWRLPIDSTGRGQRNCTSRMDQA